MIPLGHIRTGVMHIAKRAASLASDHGEIAVFIGRNGETAAALHYEPGYTSALQRQIRNLAGVYRHSDEPGAPQIARMVREDLLASVGRN